MNIISHKLDEVFRISDRITVLRDGQTIETNATSNLDEPRVIAQMVGRAVDQIFPEAKHERGEVVFEVRNVTVEDPSVPGKRLVNSVSFGVRKGEVLGIAGLMGSGRSELLMAIFGAHAGRKSAEMFVQGKRVQINSPCDAIERGIGFVTEDRKRYGLVLDQTILRNMTLAGLDKLSGRFFTNEDAEAAAGERAARDQRIKASAIFTIAGTLSGGNPQRVVLAKWLLTNPRLVVLAHAP